jgi:hypothetical protein
MQAGWNVSRTSIERRQTEVGARRQAAALRAVAAGGAASRPHFLSVLGWGSWEEAAAQGLYCEPPPSWSALHKVLLEAAALLQQREPLAMLHSWARLLTGWGERGAGPEK